jgi:hypothetical protein
VSDPFYRPPAGQPTFHGRVSTDRTDGGFDNYLKLTTDRYHIRIFLDDKEQQQAVTADPEAGIIKSYRGDRMVTLKGRVEIKLERTRPNR